MVPHLAVRTVSVEFDATSASTHVAHLRASAFAQPDESCCSGCIVGTKGCIRERGGIREQEFQSSPDHSFDTVFAEGGFQELWSPASVARWVKVFVFERMRDVAGDVDAGDLAPPKEVPVLFDFERIVPADRLQDVAVGDEAIADVVAPVNRALTAIMTVGNSQPFAIDLHQFRAFSMIRKGGEQIEVGTGV